MVNKKEKTKNMLQTPKGMHDILADEYVFYQSVFEKAEKVASYYGFQPIQTPILEKTELFTASVGVTTDIIEKGDHLRQKVLSNSEYLRSNLKKLGFTVLGHETSIVPLFIGSEEKAIKFYAALIKNNILAPCIRRPAVAVGKERIRFSLMATHTKEQVDTLLNACEKIGKSFKLI